MRRASLPGPSFVQSTPALFSSSVQVHLHRTCTVALLTPTNREVHGECWPFPARYRYTTYTIQHITYLYYTVISSIHFILFVLSLQTICVGFMGALALSVLRIDLQTSWLCPLVALPVTHARRAARCFLTRDIRRTSSLVGQSWDLSHWRASRSPKPPSTGIKDVNLAS